MSDSTIALSHPGGAPEGTTFKRLRHTLPTESRKKRSRRLSSERQEAVDSYLKSAGGCPTQEEKPVKELVDIVVSSALQTPRESTANMLTEFTQSTETLRAQCTCWQRAVRNTLPELKKIVKLHSGAAPLTHSASWQHNTGLFVISPQLKVLYVNSWLSRTLGYSPQAPRSRFVMDLIHPDLQSKVYGDMAKLLSAEVGRVQHHARIKCHDGSFKRFLLAAEVGQLRGDTIICGVVSECESHQQSNMNTVQAGVEIFLELASKGQSFADQSSVMY